MWWSELVPFLKKYCGFLDAEIDKEDLVNGFKHTSKGCGFMDYQDIPDVLMWMTDGGLWKAATVALLREIARSVENWETKTSEPRMMKKPESTMSGILQAGPHGF